MLTLIMVGTQSCSEDLLITDNAEVSFTATLPADVSTRAYGDGEKVNTLTVGVFDDNRNEIQRQSFSISGTSFDVSLTLAKNQTYNFIFWAYDDNCTFYDIEDLTAVKMMPPTEPVTFGQMESSDAFFSVKENITITGNINHPVTLIRPLAQINVGTAGKVIEATFMAMSAPDTFHPFSNTVSGETNFIWEYNTTTDEKFSVDGTEYNYLAMGYLFAPSDETMTVTCEIAFPQENGSTKTFEFEQIELQANYHSNIAGSFTE